MDDKMPIESVIMYSSIEAMGWLFGLAFIIDLRGMSNYYDTLSVGIAYLFLGSAIEVGKTLIVAYYNFMIPELERVPFIRQWVMFVGIGLSMAIYGVGYYPLNIVGMVLLLIFSTVLDYRASYMNASSISTENVTPKEDKEALLTSHTEVSFTITDSETLQ